MVSMMNQSNPQLFTEYMMDRVEFESIDMDITITTKERMNARQRLYRKISFRNATRQRTQDDPSILKRLFG